MANKSHRVMSLKLPVRNEGAWPARWLPHALSISRQPPFRRKGQLIGRDCETRTGATSEAGRIRRERKSGEDPRGRAGGAKPPPGEGGGKGGRAPQGEGEGRGEGGRGRGRDRDTRTQPRTREPQKKIRRRTSGTSEKREERLEQKGTAAKTPDAGRKRIF